MLRKLTPFDLALWAALPMAHTSRIEGRLATILDQTRSRCALTRRVLLTALCVGAAALVPLAMLRPAAKAQGVLSTSTPAHAALWKQTWANGATVEVLGVSHAPTREDGSGWWRPDGSPLPGAPFGPPMDNPVAGRDRRAFSLRVLSPPADPLWGLFPTCEVPGAASVGTSYAALSSYAPRLPGLVVVSAGAEALPVPGTLRCGVAGGAWETLTAGNIRILPAGGRFTFHGVSGSVIFSQTSQRQENAAVTVSDTFSDREGQSQVVAVDVSGRTFLGSGYSQIGIGGMHQTTFIFKGLPLSRAKEVRFQARPYEWVELKGIALKPKPH